MLTLLKKGTLMVALLVIGLLGLGIVGPVYADTCRIQMSASGYDPMGGEDVHPVEKASNTTLNAWTRLGQRLMITDREITGIGYKVFKIGNPAGNVTISMYDVATDEVIVSKVWGDASELPEPGSSGYCEVTLSTPMRINREVRLCVEYYGGNSTDYCVAAYYTGDKITGESYTNYRNQWHDIGEAEEGSYCYTYICEVTPPPDNGDAHEGSNMPIVVAIIGGLVVCVLGIGYLVRNKKGGSERIS